MLSSPPDVPCRLCGALDWRLWHTQAPWSVWACQACGLGRTWPEPSDADLEAFYSKDYYSRHGMGGSDRGAWLERAEGILSCLPWQPSSVLDFGAGEGQLVEAFRALGLRADGVEPSTLGRLAARERHGLELAASLPDDGGYDLVTALHVLEHVSDPVASLCRLRACAGRPAILFAEVPHAGSVDMWAAPGRRRQLLQLPGHLVHFIPGSLELAVRQAGFVPVGSEVANSRMVEWLLEQRRGSKRKERPRVADTAAPEERIRESPRSSQKPGTLLRRLWAGSLLPWLRLRLPGWRIQMVATT